MEDFINQLAFGWYPYLAVTVLFLGSIIRFDKGQYTWRAESSQFLGRKDMMLGSNLFHLGVLVLFVGHFVGLLTPIQVFETVGVSHEAKQLLALIVGGIAGIAAFIGCTILLRRRLYDPRIRRSSSFTDIGVLVLLWLQLAIGIATTYWTIQNISGGEMVLFMGWAHRLLTLNPHAAETIVDADLVFKIHIIVGLTILLVTPFTRLVHVWSAPVWYLFRPGYQIVRSLAPLKRPLSPTGGAAQGGVSFGGPAVMRGQSESGEST